MESLQQVQRQAWQAGNEALRRTWRSASILGRRIEPYAEPHYRNIRASANAKLGAYEPWQIAALTAVTVVIVLQLWNIIATWLNNLLEKGEPILTSTVSFQEARNQAASLKKLPCRSEAKLLRLRQVPANCARNRGARTEQSSGE